MKSASEGKGTAVTIMTDSVMECDLLHGAQKTQVLRKMILALVVSSCFMLFQFVGGYLTGSVAILTDAVHELSDAVNYAVAIYATVLSSKASTSDYTFGYHRAETIGGLINAVSICVLSLTLVIQAVERLIQPEPINGKLMFIFSAAGLGINILLLLTLKHDHAHGPDDGHGHQCGHGDHQNTISTPAAGQDQQSTPPPLQVVPAAGSKPPMSPTSATHKRRHRLSMDRGLSPDRSIVSSVERHQRARVTPTSGNRKRRHRLSIDRGLSPDRSTVSSVEGQQPETVQSLMETLQQHPIFEATSPDSLPSEICVTFPDFDAESMSGSAPEQPEGQGSECHQANGQKASAGAVAEGKEADEHVSSYRVSDTFFSTTSSEGKSGSGPAEMGHQAARDVCGAAKDDTMSSPSLPTAEESPQHLGAQTAQEGSEFIATSNPVFEPRQYAKEAYLRQQPYPAIRTDGTSVATAPADALEHSHADEEWLDVQQHEREERSRVAAAPSPCCNKKGASASGHEGSNVSAVPPACGKPKGAPRSGHEDNHSLQGIILHIIADITQSAALTVAGAILWWKDGDPDWLWVDPVCTFIFTGYVVFLSRNLLKSSLRDLMEATPPNIDIKTLCDALSRVDGVVAVKDLHVWRIGAGRVLMMAKCEVDTNADRTAIQSSLKEVCSKMRIDHTIVQLSEPVDQLLVKPAVQSC